MYFKYITSYLWIAVISYIGLITIFVSYFVPKMNNAFTEKTLQSFHTTSAIVDYKVSDIYNVMHSLIMSDDVKIVVESNDLMNLSFRMQQSLSNIARDMAQFKRDCSDVVDIIIYNSKCEYVITSTHGGSLDHFTGKTWFEYLVQPNTTDRLSIICQDNHIYLCQKLNPGMIIIEMNNVFDLISDDDSIYVFNKNTGDQIYSTGSAQVSMQPSGQAAGLMKNTIIAQIDNVYWFTCVYTCPAFNIFSDSIFWGMVFILALFLFLVIVLLSIHQTNISYRHITDILAMCDPDPSVSNNEWATISNHMINLSNEKLLVKKELINKIAQIKELQHTALQEQLTPHFLFNTLHMINLSIQDTIHGDCQGTKMLTQLSLFLRLTLNAGNIVSLEEELQHARSYLSIEELKYPDQLYINEQIDENLLDLKFPKLILQPLLENSIIHGMKDDAPLTVTIKVFSTQKDTVIEITDDGLGMTEEQLRRLMEHLREAPSHEHIGLANVIGRLQIYFGDSFTYNIVSKQNDGFSITLNLPQ